MYLLFLQQEPICFLELIFIIRMWIVRFVAFFFWFNASRSSGAMICRSYRLGLNFQDCKPWHIWFDVLAWNEGIFMRDPQFTKKERKRWVPILHVYALLDNLFEMILRCRKIKWYCLSVTILFFSTTYLFDKFNVFIVDTFLLFQSLGSNVLKIIVEIMLEKISERKFEQK